MIVLDTNVVSELMRPSPAAQVVAWVDQQRAADLWLTSVTVAELLAGVAVLPAGARKQRLATLVQTLLTDLFADRVLPFDATAATAYAGIVAARRRAGSPIGTADAFIAATCLAVGVERLVTRNTSDFIDTGVPLLDPWQHPNG